MEMRTRAGMVGSNTIIEVRAVMIEIGAALVANTAVFAPQRFPVLEDAK